MVDLVIYNFALFFRLLQSLVAYNCLVELYHRFINLNQLNTHPEPDPWKITGTINSERFANKT